jgi:deferrochelatase/peroxidase EfeB
MSAAPDSPAKTPPAARERQAVRRVRAGSLPILAEALNEHVQRRVEEELGERLEFAWVVAGSQRHNSRSGRVNRREGRALIGFLDGTSNLDPLNSPDDAKLVFVDPAGVADYPPRVPSFDPGQPSPYGPQPPTFPADLRNPPTREPDWTKGGSYLVARASVIDTGAWDDRPLGEQEHVIGRFKVSGSGLDKPDDPSQPACRARLPRGPGRCDHAARVAHPQEQPARP